MSKPSAFAQFTAGCFGMFILPPLVGLIIEPIICVFEDKREKPPIRYIQEERVFHYENGQRVYENE